MPNAPMLTDSDLRVVLAASGAGAWEWDATEDTIAADLAYRILYGFSAEERLGSVAWRARLHPDDRDRVLCHVADCLRAGDAWREEFRIEHPARGERWLEGNGRVLRDEAGRILGLIGLNTDITDRKRAELALRESEARLRSLIDNAIDGIIAIDCAGRIASINPAGVRIFGYQEGEVIGRNVSMLMPEPYCGEHDGYIARYLDTGRARIIGIGREVLGRRKDGSVFPLDLGISEASLNGGRIFIGFIRDITERKKAEETQRRLIDEINHRVKNTLMTAQAMAEQTLHTASDPRHFVESFRGRLQALSRSHNLLTERSWSGVDVMALVREQLGPTRESGRVTLRGPELDIRSQVAVHLGLVLNELASNARRHGSLSVPDGRLEVTWSVESGTTGNELRLRWVESGGPVVANDVVPGFGMLLIERGVRHTLRGESRLAFNSGGVECEIQFPL